MVSIAMTKLDGKQVDWDAVARTPEQPLITIITSTYNAARDLHHTGDSIRKQSYPFIQWIIADGGSDDGTVAAIEQYHDIVDAWFSEPDSGIYDAWNKALRYAKGDWIQFLGAGDELADFSTLEKIVPVLAKAHPQHDLVYGNLLLLTEENREVLDCLGESWLTMKDKWSGFRPWLPAHPSVFHHNSLFGENEPFDLRFKIAADSYFMMKSIKKKAPLYTELLIDKMPVGGVSSTFTSVLNYYSETKQIARVLGYVQTLKQQVFEYFLLITKFLISSVFPCSFSYVVADSFRLLCGKKKRWSREIK